MNVATHGRGICAVLAVIVAVLALSPPAHAGLVTFDFGEASTGSLFGSGDDEGYRALVNGVTLTAHGYKGVDLGGLGDDVAGSFDDTEAVVLDTSGGNRGLSVDSGSGDDEDRLDGDGPDEAIWFDLALGGYLTQIVFDNFGGSDDFNLVVDGVVAIVDLGGLADDTWMGQLAFDASLAIGADGRSDAFRIRSLTIAVPEPGQLAFMLLGVLLIVNQRKRRSNDRRIRPSKPPGF